MIIYPAWTDDTDRLAQIKDRLEIEETVKTLLRQPGQEADRYEGTAVKASRPPADNYVIGHGIEGLPHWLSGATLADNLVARGLQTGDRIYLVCCFAAKPVFANDSSAEELAGALTALNVRSVTIFACPGYVNWNAGGPLLITNYGSTDDEVKKAARAWTKAEDKAWNTYVADLRKAITGAVATVPADRLPTMHGLMEAFGKTAVSNDRDFIARLAKADPKTDAEAARKIYVNLINDASARENPSRANQHQQWSEALRGLLTDVHALATDLLRGKTAAAAQVTKARAAMHTTLAQAWPAYSSGYYDRLRTLAGPNGKSLTWEQFTT